MKALDNFEHILAEQEKAKKSTKTANINKKGGNNIGYSQKKRKTQKG